MNATITAKEEIAEGTLEIVFTLEKPLEFQAGQYCHITLLESPIKDTQGLKHHFSIVSPPSQNSKVTIATRIRQTPFKQALLQLPIGTPVDLDNVEGYFLLPQKENLKLVYIAGGIGITPFMCHLQHIIDKNLSFDITLLYSNKNQKQAAYLERLQKWDQEHDWFGLTATMTEDENWKGAKGRIDGGFIKKQGGLSESTFYVAGPPAMVMAMREILTKELQISPDFVLTENFTGY